MLGRPGFPTLLETGHDFEKRQLCPLVLWTSPPSLSFSPLGVFEKLRSFVLSSNLFPIHLVWTHWLLLQLFLSCRLLEVPFLTGFRLSLSWPTHVFSCDAVSPDLSSRCFSNYSELVKVFL